MSKDEVSRRVVVGALGIGAASTAIGVVVANEHTSEAAAAVSDATEPEAVAVAPPAGEAATLLAPLTAGARLGRWTIDEILPVQDGAASVVLSDASGSRFQLDVCARDTENVASRGPGTSELFEVFLANQGDGATSTHEDHGLAAMAVAEIVRANEHRVERTAFQTLRQRIEARRARRHVT